MDRENTRKSLYLPQEIIEEILSRIAAKSVLRLRCVSKSWRCLIDSERFIKAQLEKSIKDPSFAHWRVVFGWKYGRNGLTQCSANSYLNEVDKDSIRRPFDDSTNNHLTTPDCGIVGHCNGLLCINKQECFFLWNPTTRISIKLPKLKTSYYYVPKCGFGMDEHSGAYKVFVVLPKEYGHELIGKVYSSETKSLKTVEGGGLDVGLAVEDDTGVFVGGKLYWLKDKESEEIYGICGACIYMESFDLTSEVFEMIELPYRKGGKGHYRDYLGVASGMLRVTLTFYSDAGEERNDEWVRVTKSGEKEHWAKLESERDEEPENIVHRGCGEFVYVESLVWPIPLNNG